MILLVAFCIVVSIQIFFYLFLFGKFAFSTSKKGNFNNLPISLIVCAKNEVSNLKKNFPFIASQNYKQLEIVLIDDASNDGTLQLMNSFKKNYQNLNIQVVAISKKDSGGKKYALSEGIKKASHDLLILTDADCAPSSIEWIREMGSHFSKDKSVVLGYGAYKKIKNSFINKLIRFETLLTAIQYFSFAKINKAYMGVGRNIAYKKKEFIKNKGFTEHDHIISGDDDLFISQIAGSNNIATCFSEQSFTISEPKIKFNNWIKQKRRHISTSYHYKFYHKISLGLFYISQILFWILALTLLVLKINVPLVLLIILIRIIVWYITIINSAKKLDEKDLIIFAPLYEISIIFIQLYIFIRNIISPPKYW